MAIALIARSESEVKRLGMIMIVFALMFMMAGVALTAAAEGPCGETYTVVRGDTLTAIAQRCNTTVSALLEANPAVTDPDLISVGQHLTIPQ